MVYIDDCLVAFMDIQPVNPGHLLVIPRHHVASLAELEPGVAGRLCQLGIKLAAAVRQSEVRCEGVNLLVADGEAAGQEVFHVHLHVIPRFRGDGFGFRFGPEYHRRPDRRTLDRIAADIRSVLQE